MILLCAAALAQDPPPSRVVSDAAGSPPSGIGIGVMVGAPTGISIGYRPSEPWMVNVGLAWSVPESQVHVHADYLHTVYEFRDPNTPRLSFPINVGLGLRVRTWDPNGNRTTFGVRVPGQLTLVPLDQPFDVFFEVAPVVQLWPETSVSLDAALGARFFF